MMKVTLLSAIVLLFAVYYSETAKADLTQDSETAKDIEDIREGSSDNSFNCNADAMRKESPVCYIPNCMNNIVNHIEEELNAAFSYMYMAAFFDDNRKARPGLAKFLYESANEERSHAIMMLEYLNKRGILYEKPYKFFPNSTLLTNITSETTYESVLNTALKMEVTVTNSIYEIIQSCGEDFHGADYFTNPILEEQHDGIRKIQGAIQEFQNLKAGHGDDTPTLAMAEYLFDMKVLEKGI